MDIKNWDSNLKVRLIGEFLFNLMFWMFYPFMAMYFSHELGKGLAGTLLIVSQAISVVFNLFGGYFSDAYGRRTMMLFAGWGQVLSLCIMTIGSIPSFENTYIVFIGFAALSIMSSLYMPASQAMVADVVTDKERNNVFALFYTANNLSVVIGPLLGAIWFFSNRFALMIGSTIVTILILFSFQKLLHETVPKNRNIEKISSAKQFLFSQLKSYQIIFKDKLFFLFIVAGILAAQTYTQMDLLISVYVYDTIEKTIVSIGQFITIEFTGEKLFSFLIAENGLIVVCLTVFLTALANRMKEKWVFVLSVTLYSVSMVIFANSYGFIGCFIAMAIFTFGEVIVVGVQNGFIAKIAPEETRGQYFAAASLRFSIGRTIAPIAIPLSALIGFKGTFYTIGGITLFAAFLYFAMFHLYEKRLSNKSLN